jgi:ribosomal protein S18 acetylase RimI-like enzyme
VITYRPGNQKDIKSIAAILIETWKRCYSSFVPNDFLENLSLERQIIRHAKYMETKTKYFVAETEDQVIVGFSSYGKNRIEKIDCENELYTFYVKTEYQKNGIGHSLLNLILSELESSNQRIAVSVFEKNLFKKFYSKNGFVKIDTEIIDLGQLELVGEIYIR